MIQVLNRRRNEFQALTLRLSALIGSGKMVISDGMGRWILAVLGGVSLVYSLLVLGFAATAPDLGLRFLLVDEGSPAGPTVRTVMPTMRSDGEFRPEVGDELIGLGGPGTDSRQARFSQPILSFLHFCNALNSLRGETPFVGGKLQADVMPSTLGDKIPTFVEKETGNWLDRERWVEARFRRAADGTEHKTWLEIQSLSTGELFLPLLWFLLELGIFTVGAVAFWTRPFDRAARVFFAMCLVTMGAFVGGYHWWIIAGTPLLNIPFAICAILAPAVTLHFFLIFPYPKGPIATRPQITLIFLYTPPVIAILVLVSLLCYCSWLFQFEAATSDQFRYTLMILRNCVYGYLIIAALYFVGSLFALYRSFFAPRNTLEQQQVFWILWAGVISTVPVGYTFYLAQFDRVAFAIGKGSLPMFSASLLFMMAYAIGIARYKLMLVDQFFSRETTYFVATAVATVTYSALGAIATLTAMLQYRSSHWQAIVISTLLMVALFLLNWLRGRAQRLIDRRFFREKYQLDKALKQMNQMAGQLLEPPAVAERMLASCRDVLLVGRAALYFLDADRQRFRLVAAEGERNVPTEFAALPALLAALQKVPSLQRNALGPEDEGPLIEQVLRDLKADLLQALEVDGVVEGVVLLGEKRNGTDYSAEDLTFLTAMGQVAGVAMHSAKVHQVVGQLNAELQMKVEKISEQQRQIAMLQSEIVAAHTLIIPVKAPEPPGEHTAGTFRCDQIRGSSPAIVRLLETVRKVANSDSSVLIRGESGTGKELLAEAIHLNSARKQGPLVKVHCGALSSSLLESELFGHVKGSFTGAQSNRQGRFELANGGTLFLDEIGDISLETQIKLLRVLQEREFEPVGGVRTIQVDVRLITATHQNLERLISEGKFREDLFYRLNVITITPPPLRERSEDIIELAMYFMTRAAQKLNKPINQIEGAALDRLRNYPWPGNIRELENSIERAVVLTEGDRITVQDLPMAVLTGHASNLSSGSRVKNKRRSVFLNSLTTTTSTAEPLNSQSPGETLSDADAKLVEANHERAELIAALQQCQGNKAEAARLLGLPRSTFFSRLKKHSLSNV
ncbi:MAG: zraR 8 [Planctomycetaceae bacterium]|nr:zraR 8 [Planctomycetaceae bacterium]